MISKEHHCKEYHKIKKVLGPDGIEKINGLVIITNESGTTILQYINNGTGKEIIKPYTIKECI